MGMPGSDQSSNTCSTWPKGILTWEPADAIELRTSAAQQRRPSFPQGGVDWRARHKCQHDSRRSQRRKTVSVCVLPESEEEEDEDGRSPKNMPTHEHSCPLFQPDAGSNRTLPLEDNVDNVNENPSKVPASRQTDISTIPSSCRLYPPPPIHSSLSKLQCNCSFREAVKSRNNNNNDEENDDQNNGSEGGEGENRREGGGGGRRRKKRKNRRETVIINVGGQVFETYKSTLRRLRTPIFHSDDKLELYYRRSHGDYFFDRDATAFGSILNFLRTGELHIPTNMCGPALQNELEFWGIDEVDIARCCWTQYNTWKTQCRSLEKLEYDRKFSTTQQQVQQVDPASPCWVRYRSKIWTFLQDPGSSKKAKAYAWVSIIFVFISIFSFCAETHPMFKVKAKDMTHLASFYGFFNLEPVQWSKLLASQNNVTAAAVNANLTTANDSNMLNSSASNWTSKRTDGIRKRSDMGFYDETDVNDYYNFNSYSAYDDDDIDDEGNTELPHPALVMMDVACLIFFSAEYLTRFICSPNKTNFLRALQNIVDFLAFAPDYVELLFLIIDPPRSEGMAIMEMLFILRILRLFRIFRLIRHVPGLWILLYTLKASFNELMLMCVFLLIGMVVFATLIHFLEPDGVFTNIPIGFWWSVVTMTTVGYGDMHPVSAAGYIIGSCCAVAGLLMIAFTVPIIVSNFVLYYTHVQYGLARRDRELERMKEEEEQELARSRSHLDVERAGSLSSSTFSPIHPETTRRNGKSYSYVNNKSDLDTPPVASNTHAAAISGVTPLGTDYVDNNDVLAQGNTTDNPHTLVTLENDPAV